MEKVPDIKPIKLKEYNVKQSKYNMVGRIPVRQIVLGPSGCGKGVFIQNESLQEYTYFLHHLRWITKHGNP